MSDDLTRKRLEKMHAAGEAFAFKLRASTRASCSPRPIKRSARAATSICRASSIRRAPSNKAPRAFDGCGQQATASAISDHSRVAACAAHVDQIAQALDDPQVLIVRGLRVLERTP